MNRLADSRRAAWRGALRSLSVVAAAGLLWNAGLSADERLAEVIRNVGDNEKLYENLDASLQTEYDIGDRTPFKGPEGNEIVRKQTNAHFVSQDGLFRLETKGAEFDPDRGPSPRDKVRIFGGERTKLLEDKLIGNVIAGRVEDDEFVRPHALLLRYQSMPVPLSAYLRGHDAVRAIVGSQWLGGLGLAIAYGGEDEFQGLKCHTVVVTTAVPGSDGLPSSISQLWLAESRNYLPIRLLVWAPRVSADIPRVEGFVGEMRELKPGIWFPVRAQLTSYQQAWLLRGKQEVQWREEYVVESASLEPQYDLAYFNDLEFPNGTAVYEVENRQMKKSYRVGAPEAPNGPPAAGLNVWWLLSGNLAVVGVIAAAVFWRRSRALKSVAGGPDSAGR